MGLFLGSLLCSIGQQHFDLIIVAIYSVLKSSNVLLSILLFFKIVLSVAAFLSFCIYLSISFRVSLSVSTQHCAGILVRTAEVNVGQHGIFTRSNLLVLEHSMVFHLCRFYLICN